LYIKWHAILGLNVSSNIYYLAPTGKTSQSEATSDAKKTNQKTSRKNNYVPTKREAPASVYTDDSTTTASDPNHNAEEDDVCYQSALSDLAVVHPELADSALDESDSFFMLTNEMPSIILILDIKRELESIIFKTEGMGRVRLEVKEESGQIFPVSII
jgi:hypothetical protein